MRVKGVTPHLADLGGGKNLLFVKVETEGGPHGWGECYTQADRDASIVAHVEGLGRYLPGATPRRSRTSSTWPTTTSPPSAGRWTSGAPSAGSSRRSGTSPASATASRCTSSWAARCRERIRVYANGWYGHGAPAEYAEQARETVGRGFTALKFDPFPGPWRTHISREAEEQAVATVAAVREAVGPAVDLLIEVHRRLAPMHAVRIARAMEPFRPFWYEEPVSSTNLEALAECRRQIGIPIVTGEELYTRAEFRRVFELRAADIINPDVCNCGGILELRAIAQMAEPSFVTVSPHNYNSTTVGLAATLQVSAAIPNFLITEYFVNFEAKGREIARPGFEVRDGYIAVPERPGLGIELDEAALARFPGRQFPPRTLPSPATEGP